MKELKQSIDQLKSVVSEVETTVGDLTVIHELKQAVAEVELQAKTMYEDYWQSSSSPAHWSDEGTPDWDEDWSSSSYDC
jgi:hypothetical protein